jgi:hypothetical protein
MGHPLSQKLPDSNLHLTVIMEHENQTDISKTLVCNTFKHSMLFEWHGLIRREVNILF